MCYQIFQIGFRVGFSKNSLIVNEGDVVMLTVLQTNDVTAQTREGDVLGSPGIINVPESAKGIFLFLT